MAVFRRRECIGLPEDRIPSDCVTDCDINPGLFGTSIGLTDMIRDSDRDSVRESPNLAGRVSSVKFAERNAKRKHSSLFVCHENLESVAVMHIVKFLLVESTENECHDNAFHIYGIAAMKVNDDSLTELTAGIVTSKYGNRWFFSFEHTEASSPYDPTTTRLYHITPRLSPLHRWFQS